MKRKLLYLILPLFLALSGSFVLNGQNNSYSDEITFGNGQARAVIYPNPITEGRFYVKANRTIKSVEVINIIGQSIRTVRNETGLPYNIFVQLPECDEGIYMVKISYANHANEIRKVLVK